MKWLIGIVFVAILAALFAAGRALMTDGRDGAPKTDRMLHALALRIGLSVALFVFILVAWKLGWIKPTGLPLSR